MVRNLVNIHGQISENGGVGFHRPVERDQIFERGQISLGAVHKFLGHAGGLGVGGRIALGQSIEFVNGQPNIVDVLLAAGIEVIALKGADTSGKFGQTGIRSQGGA